MTRHHTRQMILEGLGSSAYMNVTLERGDTAWEPVPVRGPVAGWNGPTTIRYTRQPGGNVTAVELPTRTPPSSVVTTEETRPMNVQTDTVQGTYRVSFRIAETGHYRGMLSARTVRAESREAAVASVPGGVSAEVLVWGPKDSH